MSSEIIQWLGSNAAAVQALAAVASVIIAVPVAWVGYYTVRTYHLERDRHRAERLRFVSQLLNLASSLHEFWEFFTERQKDGTVAEKATFLDEHFRREAANLRALIAAAVDVPPRVVFLLESAQLMMKRLDGAFHPEVLSRPDLVAGIYLDLKRAKNATIQAYLSLPTRHRRPWSLGEDFAHTRQRIQWLVVDGTWKDLEDDRNLGLIKRLLQAGKRHPVIPPPD